MLSVLIKLPLLSLTARLTPELLERQNIHSVNLRTLVEMGKTQLFKKQVIFHLICEGTTHQGEIHVLLKLFTRVTHTSNDTGLLETEPNVVTWYCIWNILICEVLHWRIWQEKHDACCWEENKLTSWENSCCDVQSKHGDNYMKIYENWGSCKRHIFGVLICMDVREGQSMAITWYNP